MASSPSPPQRHPKPCAWGLTEAVGCYCEHAKACQSCYIVDNLVLGAGSHACLLAKVS